MMPQSVDIALIDWDNVDLCLFREWYRDVILQFHLQSEIRLVPAPTCISSQYLAKRLTHFTVNAKRLFRVMNRGYLQFLDLHVGLC